MGLYKKIKQPNGITLTYHRIESLNISTNATNLISVASYIDQEARDVERDAVSLAAQTGNGAMMDVYIRGRVYEAPYDQSMTISGAYGYLKTLDDFKGAQDVLEEESA